MPKTRKSHGEVLQTRIDLLKGLEAEKVALEKERAKAANPLSLMLAAKIAIVVAQIAAVVKAFKRAR